jgi:predicted nuclease of predicted toxin-antitoxin system
VKLLLDANISWRLCKELTKQFGLCVHINQTILPKLAADFEIWKYAKNNGFTIITQDSDFLSFFAGRGFPPKIILVKIGNNTKDEFLKVLLEYKNNIIDFSCDDNLGLLEIS